MTVAEYPHIDEPPEPITWSDPAPAPTGPRPAWARSEDWIRWILTGGYVVALAGLVSTIGGTVAPWLGWVILLVASGAPALWFWGKFVEEAGNRDRSSGRPAAGAAPRFQGGTSFGAGPGRDDPGHRHPQPGSDQDDDTSTNYP